MTTLSSQVSFGRRLRWRLKLQLARWLIGDKSTSAHFALVGPDSAGFLCERIIESGHRNVLVVTDKPLRELGIADRALAVLTASDVAMHWFDGVRPDPTFGTVQAGAAIFRQHGCTAVVAVGGGSSIDAAKVIAACAEPDSDPLSWVGLNNAPEDVAPIYAIPTTAGTGSEATVGAVITDETDHTKRVIAGPGFLPRAVALDAELMLGLPATITAATALDALTHGIEAYLSVWDRGTRSETALMAITGIFKWLPRVLATPDDMAARQGISIAAYYGGVAINQVNVGNVHAIAHQLGARYGIPHGLANALVLPHVLRTYGEAAAPGLATLAEALGIAHGGSEAARAEAMIRGIEDLRDSADVPARHSAIRAEDYPAIVRAAIEEGDGYFSPRLLAEAEVNAILQEITGADAAVA